MTTPLAPNRLLREYRRLYANAAPTTLVRALVLEVAQPTPWPPLAAVWQGVQAELDLPAPGIAVNGVDGLQLWFSLAEPVQPAQGLAFLDALRRRFLAQLPEARLRACTPVADAPPPAPPEGPWPAFVAADLAPIFDDTPWLDVRPGDEGQADLLSRLQGIKPAQWAAAWARLQPAQPGAAVQAAALLPPAAAHPQALRFLMAVMDDTSAPLALRVEAAKALLPYGGDPASR